MFEFSVLYRGFRYTFPLVGHPKEACMSERPNGSSENNRQNPYRQESRLIRWIFLDGNRPVLIVELLVVIFLLTVLLSRIGLITVLNAGPITTLVGALIGGMLPFITVVLAIIQLTLSEEFGTTGTFRERLDETETFRRNIEDHTNVEISPAEPDDFLHLLIGRIGEYATELSERNLSNSDNQLKNEIDEYVEFLSDQVA